MNRKTTQILYLLLAVLVALTSTAPTVPAKASPPLNPAALAGATFSGSKSAQFHAVNEANPALPSRAQESEAIDPSPYHQFNPKADADSVGNLYVVWEDYRDSDVSHIRFAARPAGGDWGASVKVDPSGTDPQYRPVIAVDGSGNGYAVWEDRRDSVSQIYFAYRPAGGGWGTSAPVSASAQAQYHPALAVNRRGEAVVTWLQGTYPTYDVFSAVRPVGGVWSAAEKVNETSGNLDGPDASLDNWSRAYVVWAVGSNVYFATRPSGGPWSANEQVRDTTTAEASDARLAVDGTGNAHAVWEDRRSGAGIDIYTAYRPAGGPWSVNVRVNDDTDSAAQYLPDLAVDGAGNASAVWLDYREGNSDIYGATRYLGGPWGANELLVAAPVPPKHVATNLPLAPLGWDYPIYTPTVLPGLGNIFTQSLKPGDPDSEHNVYWTGQSSGPGASGNCSGASKSQSSARSVELSAALDRCRGSNGSQEPSLNGDSGDASRAPERQGFAMTESVIDGQTVYVVKTSGGDLITTDRSEAEKFLQKHTGSSEPQSPAKPPTQSPQLPVEPSSSPPPPESSAEPPPPNQPNKPSAEPRSFEELEEELKEELRNLQKLAAEQKELARLKEELRNLQKWEAELEVDFIWLKHATPEQKEERLDHLWREYSWLKYRAKYGCTEMVKLEAKARQEAILAEIRKRHRSPGGVEAELQETRAKIQKAQSAIKSLTDPVLPHSGEFVYEQTLLRIPGRGLDYALRLSYHSNLVYHGPLGWGWEHDYDRRIVPAGGGSLGLQEGSGRVDVYSFDGANHTAPVGRYTTLVSTTTGITVTDRRGSVESYYPLNDTPAAGRLRSIADRNGNALQFAYDTSGRLQTVTDTLGREIAYTYDEGDRITAVTDFGGRSVALDYDENGDLVAITTPAVTGTPHGNDFPDGKTTRFVYSSGFDDERLNHNLTAIIAPNEVADGSLTPRTLNTYGTSGLEFDRVTTQSWGGGRANSSGVPAGGDVTFVYTTAIEADAPPGAASKTIVTDRGGNVIEMWHDSAGHRLRDRQTVLGQALVTDYTYNADGQKTSITYPAGNRVEYTYDEGNLLETRRVPDATRGCDGLGGAPCPDLITTYTYEPNFQLIQSVTDPRGNTITYTHDAQGNLVQVTFPTVTAGPAAPQVVTESWTYNTWGQPLTFTDPEGNVTSYEYHPTGYLQRTTRDNGGLDVTTEYGYDSVGNVVVITDSRSIRTDYLVNALNQVVKETRAASTALDYETLYWYDANDNLVRRDVENVTPDLDANSHPVGTHSRDAANPWFTTAYTHDLLDNVVRQTTEITEFTQITTEYRYDPLENLASTTYPEGNRVEHSYDERGKLRETTWGAGSSEALTTTYDYDGNGNLVRRTDGEGHPTDYVYDGFDRRVGSVDSLGNIRAWEYDANGNVVTVLLRDGQDGRNPGRVFSATAPITLTHTLNQLDELNRRYSEQRQFFVADLTGGAVNPLTTDGNGDGWTETSYTYDRNSNLTAITDDNEHTTRYSYDGLGRLALTTDALSNTVAYTYDGNGNLVQTLATGHQPDDLTPDETFTATQTFDAANRLIEMADNMGQTTRHAYDSRGNLVFTSDANGALTGPTNDHGNTALFAYDGLNRMVDETYHLRADGTGSSNVVGQVTVTYAYDGNGNLARRTDPNGNATAYAYDALNRLTAATYTDGTTATLAYDRANNLVQQTDANGSTVVHTYDELNRRVRADIARGENVGGTTLQTFAWDGLSRLVAATDNNDPANPSDDASLSFTYDSLLNRRGEVQGAHAISSTFDGVGNRLSLAYPGGTVLTYTYDGLNRVKSVSDTGGELASYDYIGPWRLFRRTHGNGVYAAYTYDEVRRVTDVAYRLSSDDSLLTGFSYTYDRVGNRTTETAQPGGETITYTYDSLYRLTSAQGSTPSAQYTYDAAGNRVQAIQDGQATSYTTNEVNEYLTVDGESRTHDANGNLLSRRTVVVCITLDGVTIFGQTSGYTDALYAFTGVITPADASEPITYTWSPEPDSGQGAGKAYYEWTTPGVYTITLTAENCGGPVSETHAIVIQAPPPGCPHPLEGVGISGRTSGYTGTLYTFASVITPADATKPITYTWSPEPESGQGTASTGYRWAAPGNHVITLTAENCSGTVSDTHTITIEAPPPGCPHPLEEVSISGPTSGYTDTLYTFDAVIFPSNATEPITYTWSPKPDAGQGTASASYQWAAPGVYTITLEAENCGGIENATHVITIASTPKWAIYLPLVQKSYAPTAVGMSAPNRAVATKSITETVISYRHDFANRLLGVTKVTTITVDTDVQVSTDAISYTYDGLDRQMSAHTENGAVRYLYADEHVIEERDETDALLATYVERLVMDRGGNRIFYQADATGSVRALADDTGNIVERVDYEPFGEPIFSGEGNESTLGNPYLFRGRRYDAQSGLYVYSIRRYDPDTGRYIQRGEESLGNPYTFADNNPSNSSPR